MNDAELRVKEEGMLVVTIAESKADNMSWHIVNGALTHLPEVLVKIIHAFSGFGSLDTVSSQRLPVCPISARTPVRGVIPLESG